MGFFRGCKNTDWVGVSLVGGFFSSRSIPQSEEKNDLDLSSFSVGFEKLLGCPRKFLKG